MNNDGYSETERNRQDQLYSTRKNEAENALSEYDFDSDDVEFVDAEGWETDGSDRLIAKIYWCSKGINEDSQVGQFTVDFEKNSSEIIESYVRY